MIKKILIGLGALVVLLMLAVLVGPALIPADTIRGQIETRAEAATGRSLTVGGDISVSVFPTIKVTLGEVALANAEGAQEANMVSLDRMDVALKLFPLLGGNVEVDRFILENPTVNLEIAADGTPNWVFTPEDSAEAPSSDETGGGQGGDVPAVSLGEIEISGGAFSFVDLRDGRTVSITDANLSVDAVALDQPARVSGGATVQGSPLTLDIAVSTPQALVQGSSAGIDVAIEGDLLSLSVDGEATGAAAPSFAGSISLDVPSIAALVALAPLPEPPPPLPVDSISFSGGLAASPTQASLEGFSLSVDDLSLGGDLSVDNSGTVPAVEGAISISALDLDAFTAASSNGADGGDTGQAPEPQGNTEAPTDPLQTPIDLSPLALANVDLTIDLAGLQVEGTEVGAAGVAILLQDSLLQVTLDETAIFGGTVALTAVADGVSMPPSFSGNLALDGIDVAQLAQNVTLDGVKGLSGAVTGEVNGEAAGSTPAELMADLRARSTLSLTNAGAVIDRPDGQTTSVERLTASVSLPTIDGPFEAGGNLLLNGETVNFNAQVGAPKEMLTGGSSTLSLALESNPISQSFSGSLGNQFQSIQGRSETSIPSLTGLGAWLGVPVPEGLPVDDLTAGADIAASPSAVALSDLQVQAGTLTVSGSLSADQAGAVPSLAADLDIGPLDIDALTGGGAASSPTEGGDAGDGGASGAATDWSDEPLVDYSPLLLANADLDVRIASVTVQGTTTGPTALSVDLAGGVLNAGLSDTAILGGSVGGSVSANAGSETLGVGLRVNNVSGAELLSRFGGIDWLSGTLNAGADLTMAGRSERQLVSSLNGSGDMLFADGAIQGINIAAVLRNPLQAIGNPGSLASESTDFAELGGSFTAVNGEVTNPDLRMLAPLFRLEGAGTVSLPPRSLEYRVEPTLTATLEGQGGQVSQPGLTVPIRIYGSMDDPSYGIDLRPEDLIGMVTDPGQVVDAVEGVLDGVTDGALEGVTDGVLGDVLDGVADPDSGVGAVVDGLLGTDSGSDAGEGTETPVENAVQGVVDGLLGGGEGEAEGGGLGGAVRGLFGN